MQISVHKKHNSHFMISLFQTRNTEHNFFLINLIVSETALPLLGMPMDVYNGITLGVRLNTFICPTVGFIHTFFGNYVYTILIPSNNIPNNATDVNFTKSEPTYIKTEISKFSGMSSLFTITFMSVVRYLSVVCLQRTWHLRTNNKYWSSKLIWLLWGLSFLFAAPPLVGLGQYQKDLSKFS